MNAPTLPASCDAQSNKKMMPSRNFTLPVAVSLIKWCVPAAVRKSDRLWVHGLKFQKWSSKCMASCAKPPGIMVQKFKRDATCSSRGLR